MFIYEVNLQIENTIYNEYIAWLQDHIQTILRLPGFKKALLLNQQNTQSSNEADLIAAELPKKFMNLTVQYFLDSQHNLDNYLLNHAQHMRADGLKRFNDKFRASRRIFAVSKVFE